MRAETMMRVGLFIGTDSAGYYGEAIFPGRRHSLKGMILGDVADCGASCSGARWTLAASRTSEAAKQSP